LSSLSAQTKLMPFGYKDFFMIACPNWLVANDDDLSARSGTTLRQLLAFKIKRTAAVFQIKTFIKFLILFNWA
jgi:hypothetical protein